MDVLESKRLDVVRATGALDACSELFRVRRSRGPGRTTVLLLIEPGGLEGVDLVADAVERYAPEVARWVYQAGEPVRAATRLDLRPERLPVNGVRSGADVEPATGLAPAVDGRGPLSPEELSWLLPGHLHS